MYQMLQKQSLTEKKKKRNSTWYKTIKEIESIMKTYYLQGTDRCVIKIAKCQSQSADKIRESSLQNFQLFYMFKILQNKRSEETLPTLKKKKKKKNS